jgi:cytochrome c oxidase cbb3-type subunit III
LFPVAFPSRLILTCLCTSMLAWCSGQNVNTAAPASNPPKPQTSGPEVARGQAQFAQSCSFCHGSNATGGAEGPNLMRSSVVRHDKEGDLIGQVIREGRPAKGMPPIPLNEGQIADVVAFLKARLAVSDRRSAGRPASDYSMKLLLTGNAEAGKAYFNGPGKCSTCHSIHKDLAGLAKKYPPVELQARFLYPADVPRTAVVTTRSGQKFSGEVLRIDAFDIAVRDQDGWTHSWPLSEVKVAVHDPAEVHRELLEKYTQADMHNLFAYLETLQ